MPSRAAAAAEAGSGRSVAPLLLAAPVVGAVVGAAGSFVQAVEVTVAGVAVPVGLVLALAAVVLAIAGLGRLAGSRAVAALAALGWVLAVVAALWPRAEGDVVLAAGPVAYAWLLGGLLLAAVCVLAAVPHPESLPPAGVRREPAVGPRPRAAVGSPGSTPVPTAARARRGQPTRGTPPHFRARR